MTDSCSALQEAATHLACRRTLEEQGTRVSTAEGAAYGLDTPHGRQWLGLEEGSPCCDGAFWLPSRRTILFVELKSRSFGDAHIQLGSAVEAFRAKHRCDSEIAAAVAMRGGAPQQHRKLKTDFRRKHGISLVIRTTGNKHDACDLLAK